MITIPIIENKQPGAKLPLSQQAWAYKFFVVYLFFDYFYFTELAEELVSWVILMRKRRGKVNFPKKHILC